MATWLVPRATTAERIGITPAVADLIYDTDLNSMFVGDGVTVGGLPVSGVVVWGSITGTLSNQTDLQTALDGKAASSHTHSAGDIVSGTFADARIAQSNVTQHETALTVTESQISDLGPYVPSDPSGVTGADAITNIMSLTQAEYNAITTPNASTLYVIVG